MLSTSNSFSFKKTLFLLALSIGGFYLLWMGGHSLFTPDEGRYSEVAREMIASGDFVTPRLNGVPFLDKPILYYWLQASAIYLFGIKEWVLRLWPCLLGILGCLITFIATNRLFNRRTGLLATLILATTPMYYGAAHYANLDLEVAVWITLSLWFSLLGLSSNSTEQKRWFIAAYVSASLAALTKGLIGIVFPALIIGTWIVLLRRFALIKQMYLITGLIIFTALVVPWYYLAHKANPQFLHYFFVTQQFSRFLTLETFNNRTTYWFYVPIILMGLLPWTILFLQSLWFNIRQSINSPKKDFHLFLVLWFTIVFTFFSIPRSKTIGYILPVFPVIAVMLATYLNDMWESKRKFNSLIWIYSLCCLAVISINIAIKLGYFYSAPQTVYPLLNFITLLVTTSFITLIFWQNHIKKIIINLFVTACLLLGALAYYAESLNAGSIKQLALTIKKIDQKNTNEVVSYYKYFQDLPLYLQRKITVVADWEDPTIVYRDNWMRELWYGMPYVDTHQWLIQQNELKKRWNSDTHLLVVLHKNYLEDFEKNISSTYQRLAEQNDVMLISH